MSAPSSSRWRRVYNGVILSALESPRSSNFLKDVMMPAVALLTEFLQVSSSPCDISLSLFIIIVIDAVIVVAARFRDGRYHSVEFSGI